MGRKRKPEGEVKGNLWVSLPKKIIWKLELMAIDRGFKKSNHLASKILEDFVEKK